MRRQLRITNSIAHTIGSMKQRHWWILGGVAVLGLVGTLFFVRISQEVPVQPSYTANTGELIGEKNVGQTFVATNNYLSGVAVQFATYSGRNNTKTIHFGLREWGAAEDSRTAMVPAADLGDNQLHRFAFPAIPDSAGKTYLFYVASPESSHGNAVAVDIDGRDSYPKGSVLGRPKTDVTFSLFYDVPAWAAARHWLVGWWHNFSFDQAWWPGILAAVTVTLIWWRADRVATRRMLLLTLGGLFLAALGWRWWYAHELSLTNDEGNYLYDAWMLWQGKLAGGDGYVKAPLVIGWIAAWQGLLGHTVLAGRMSSLVISALTLGPLYVLGTALWNRRVGLLAAALWAVTGAAVVFGIYVHTQPVAMFFAVSGLALLADAVRRDKTIWRFLAAGALLGLGVASRKSVLAVGLVPLVMLLANTASWKQRWLKLIWVGVGFLVVMAVFLSVAYSMYGMTGVREAVGFGSAEDSISADPAEAEQVREYSIRGMTPFFRESLPLILLSLVGLGIGGERWARRWMPPALAKLAWLMPLAVFWWAWWFFFEYEGSAFHRFGISELWYLFILVLALLAVWPEQKSRPMQSAFYAAGPLWVLGLVIFYTNWIKFHANYIAEFIPPLVILSAYGAVTWRERLPRYLREAVWLVVVVAIIVTGYVTFVFEHTGTFHQGAVDEAAAWIEKNVPVEPPIFTGAALVPYAAGRRVALDIAHPRWYAYEFTRKDPVRLNTFLPLVEKMMEAFRKSEWVLLEQQTGFSFLMEYSEIEKSLSEDFVLVHEVENGSNPLKFYRRARR